MSKKYTTNRTELPITIFTDYEYRKDDALEAMRQQIEQSGFHLQTLFNGIKRSALFMEKYFDDSASDEIRGFCSDLMNTAGIGNGLCMNVWRAVSDLTDLQMKSEADAETEETVIGASSPLAEMLSFILTAKEAPLEITEAISDALVDMANSSKQSEVLTYEKSSEHIERVLRDYWQSENEK